MASLTVPGSLDHLDDIRAFVMAQADEFGLDDRRAYRLGLAVDEIATNIIAHGYAEADLEGDVRVLAERTDDGLEIVLEDWAPAFDPLSRAQPDNLDAPLEERDIGGLGIFLAKENVDEFRYERVDGRNRNIFVMHSEPPA
jgi:serine/threonine-protein kinase RsbW